MHQITLKDMPVLDLGDKRRNERFIKILDNVTSQPGSSVPKQSESWYETKATYNFFKNKDVTLERLQTAVYAYGAHNVLLKDLDTLLIAHDTSTISYNDLEAVGLGYIDNKIGRGIFLHNSIAVSTSGIPLELLYQQLWTRRLEELGKTKDRRKKPFEEKESYKWFKGIEETNQQLGNTVRKVHIGDREADIYELFFMPPQANSELLIRARQQRKTINSPDLWEEISALPVSETITLSIPDATGKKKQDVKAEVRYRNIEILQPSGKNHQHNSVKLTAIEVREKGIDDEEKGVWWKLLTTIEINNVEDVRECIRWYTYRWLIERFHYTLKSGCKIEALQLKQAETLKKAIVIYSLAAFKIMQLTYQSRETPEVSCEVILTQHEWESLHMMIHKTNQLPDIVPTLQQATAWIGRLGGHLGRKSDGPPGLKTIWRGYQRLRDYAEIYSLLKPRKFG